jgi:hypothetical protein
MNWIAELAETHAETLSEEDRRRAATGTLPLSWQSAGHPETVPPEVVQALQEHGRSYPVFEGGRIVGWTVPGMTREHMEAKHSDVKRYPSWYVPR